METTRDGRRLSGVCAGADAADQGTEICRETAHVDIELSICSGDSIRGDAVYRANDLEFSRDVRPERCDYLISGQWRVYCAAKGVRRKEGIRDVKRPLKKIASFRVARPFYM